MDLRDGAVFFNDTVTGTSNDNSDLSTRDERSNGSDGELDVDAKIMSDKQSSGDQYEFKRTYTAYDSVLKSETESKTAKLLGSSFVGDVEDQELHSKKKSRLVSERLLKSLLTRYPQGKLWFFDVDGSNLSAEDESPFAKQLPEVVSKSNGLIRKQTETKLLQLTFPGVRQLLFVPLWDAGQTRWFAGYFCSSTSVQHVLWSESELSFLTAYNNTVMAEVSSLATIAADQ